MKHAKAIEITIRDLEEIIAQPTLAAGEGFFSEPYTAEMKQAQIIASAKRLIELAGANPAEWEAKVAEAEAEVAEADHPRYSICR
jgi:hypothetical protein